MNTARQSLKQRVYQEFKNFLILAFYLWIVFGLLELHRAMILSEQHIDFAFHGFALINALALAKVMLLARHLHLGDQLNERPLIYPTLGKSALFTIVLACFKFAEDGVLGWYRGESFRQSFADFGGGTLPGILTMCLLVFTWLVPFVGYGELRRVFGEGFMEKLFFHRHVLPQIQEPALRT